LLPIHCDVSSIGFYFYMNHDDDLNLLENSDKAL
jgi:hypothetical protein